MKSTLFLKLFGGLTITLGIATGGYLLKQNFSKSSETKKPSVSPDGLISIGNCRVRVSVFPGGCSNTN